ncbi:unnamed protein product [Cuscuta europaea]|uniref:Retrovirus-related Pol polyprotein from transposon TNT 1-94-like beta-barrel domain-containing protein n=1 Tax=Cuscuta europaea TaxID=41803 RepID=A0A9P1EDJ9_CUSEU|nr:unnamed protein product [Cuscuta europaea]
MTTGRQTEKSGAPAKIDLQNGGSGMTTLPGGCQMHVTASKGPQIQANAMAFEGEIAGRKSGESHHHQRVPLLGNMQITTERMTGMLSTKSWIIDTGASNHVTGRISNLFNIKDIAAQPVGLPDGQTVQATKQGSIKLSDQICLENVLYVPKLN